MIYSVEFETKVKTHSYVCVLVYVRPDIRKPADETLTTTIKLPKHAKHMSEEHRNEKKKTIAKSRHQI